MKFSTETLLYVMMLGAGITLYFTTDLPSISMTLSAGLGAGIMQLIKRYDWMRVD